MHAIGFIDIQNDFMRPTGALYVPGAETLIKSLTELQDNLVDDDLPFPSFFTADAHDGTEPEMVANGGPFPPHCMVGTPGADLVVQPYANQAVFLKQCYDVFDPKAGSKHIEPWLKDNNIKHVLLVGVALDYCVKAAALGLAKRGIEVYVATDMTKGVAEASTTAALAELYKAGVSVGHSRYLFADLNQEC